MTPREEIDLPFGIKLKGEGVAGMLTRQLGWIAAVACLIYAIVGPLARVEAKITTIDGANAQQHGEIKSDLNGVRADIRRLESRLALTTGRQLARAE